MHGEVTPALSASSVLAGFGESVDRVMSVEITGRAVTGRLYSAAREVQGGPLAMRAAQLLKSAVHRPRDVVLIATGFPIAPFFGPEQDGLVGAASLARGLILAYGVTPILLVNPADAEAARAALIGAGVYCFPPERSVKLPVSASVIALSADPGEAEAMGSKLLQDFAPRALVSIERPGANEIGHYHSGGGLRLTEHCAKVEVLLPALAEEGIPLIAIGDGGNELGCDLIREAVLAEVPGANRCQCPCGGSLVPTAKFDLLLIAAISNWGAYAIEACLAAIERRPEILHSAEIDARIHSSCAGAMANNGAPNLLDPGSDAVPVHIHASFLDLLAWMITAGVLDAGRYYRRPRYPWLG